MAYKKPGAYAQFIRTANPVNNPGATRIMGLVGTGLTYFQVYNEPISKSKVQPYDALQHENVFEVTNVSSKPIFADKNTPDNVFYKQGTNFELKDGTNIAWSILASEAPDVDILAVNANDSSDFKQQITCLVDPTNQHYVQDGEWVIEITYIDEDAGLGSGAYRVLNNVTKEIIGEYAVNGKPRLDAIPGVQLTVNSTYVVDATTSELTTQIGSYVLVRTIAGKTEKEPILSYDTTVVNYSADLQTCILELMVVNSENVKTSAYDIKVIDPGTRQFTITEVGTTSPLYTGVVGDQPEYLEVIPGITFIFNALVATINANDTIRIKTVEWVSGAAPAEGDTYYVSYKYHKAEIDYMPKIFFDYDTVVAQYGNYDVTATSKVINSLSLGAEIALTNGVVPIVCVQAKNDSDYEMKIAVDKLVRELPGVNNINVVIPLTTSQEVAAYVAKHVDLMSSYEFGKERMAYFGAYPSQLITKNPTALDKTIGMSETAKSYANERIVFVTPGALTKTIRDLRTGKYNNRTLPACYAAVAVSSLGLVNDPAEPLTNKTIGGFNQLVDLYTEAEKNFLAGAGCLVLEQRGSNIRVRHGITTSTEEVNSSEITLIQIKDYVIEACRQVCGDLYVGRKNMPSILSDVNYTISNILNQFVSQQILLGFSGLTVKRNADNPTQIDVRFEIEAVYPLNYISITFGFSANS